jgi:RNA polymerase primary sigma factor
MSNEELVKQIQKGINSVNNMELLYQQNDGYSRKIAKKYCFMDDISDLMQEAYFGLYEAVNRYEDTAGVLFMTYAAYWIKQSIIRYLESNGRTVRIPSGLNAKMLRYKKVITAYELQLGRKPTDYELCRHLGVDNNILTALRKAIYQFGNIKSLNEPLQGSEDDSILLGDGVPDLNTNIEKDTIDRMIDNRIHSELWQIVEHNTTPEENSVIQARYIQSMTLEATGQSIGQSREKARQIEARALRKLRLPRIRRKLEEKFEMNYARGYRGSITNFKYTGTSITEYIALCNLELEGIK